MPRIPKYDPTRSQDNQNEEEWRSGRKTYEYRARVDASKLLCLFKHKWSMNWKEQRKRCLRCGKVKQF